MRAILSVSAVATLLLSSAAFAQTSSDDDRFKPRTYGSLAVTGVDYGNMEVEIFEPVQTQTTTVVVEPVSPSMDTVIASTQDQAVIDEAARIRAYRSVTPQVTTQPMPQNIELYAPAPSTTTVQMNQSHVVAKGDTLYNISKRYGTTVSAIQDMNGLSGTGINLGQALSIPTTSIPVQSLNTTIAQPIFASAPVQQGVVTRRVVQPVSTISSTQTYAVLPKDTLYSISRRSCVAVNDLIQANNITNPNALKPGQMLTLPSGHCIAK